MIRSTFYWMLFFFVSGNINLVSAQVNTPYRDTVHNFAIDSVQHNLGKINPEMGTAQLIKRFKYLGDEPVWIQKAWTGDPHFICGWPKGPLIPNKVYEAKICFFHKYRMGVINKKMGFLLSNGERISFHFTGEYLKPTEQIEKH